ncbi:MAG TPA: bifunctional DNA-binding transcriptional regulator/O6-methylguanine-DNA methyltransferase Ada [Solibacterales bacterium]|nr:bifunctional DNA-binding transcriptional regulator/O6-methylguanine-DNA methyltransferase Ada [Bryobacterales bacterium]
MIIDEDRCWEAMAARDRAWDGKFFCGVVTTGVYCRPSCPARPRRENVRFFATAAEAERAGLRPCLRCRPLETVDPGAARVLGVARYLREHAAETVSLEALSRASATSPFHLQRRFKAMLGVTPREYQEAWRLKTFKKELKRRRPVTEALYEAGFGSSSRLYERVDTRLGMTPSVYRAGGKGVEISHVCVPTPLGPMMIGATDRGLCFVQFGESGDQLLAVLRAEYPEAALTPMAEPHPEQFRLWIGALCRSLEGVEPRLDLPLDVRATAFQMRVWKYLQSIPRGEVQSYGEVARGLGSPAAHRAVARACASNPVALVIPCHRVIRGDGALGGYRWGLERKRALIDRERAAAR